MPAASLYEMAKNRLIQNIAQINDVGDLEYDFVAPILKHVHNPDQLAEIEQNCPQIRGETGDLWLRFIKRDIPRYEQLPHQPRNPQNWSKVYMKLKRNADAEQKKQEDDLKRQMQALQQNKQKNQTSISADYKGFESTFKKPYIRGFGTGAGRFGGPAGPRAPAKTGREALDKMKRQIFQENKSRPKASLMTAQKLAERKPAVAAAPARMVRMAQNAAADQRKPAETEPKPAAAPSHPHLPAGQRFNVPRLPSEQPRGLKRKPREAPNPLMSVKRQR